MLVTSDPRPCRSAKTAQSERHRGSCPPSRFSGGACDVEQSTSSIDVRRSVVDQVVGRCKTKASEKPVPLDEYMASDLLEWFRYTQYRDLNPCYRRESLLANRNCVTLLAQEPFGKASRRGE